MNLLPGPVTVSTEVQEAFGQLPISHRSFAFLEMLRETKERLCLLVGSRYAELMIGSGTLANDIVAGQLSRGRGRGLILTNGEFGERLVDHARRFGLSFDVLGFDWGAALDLARVEQALDRGVDWLWAVHCETSTGVLNDLDSLKEMGTRRNVLVCMDCISSIGTVPVALDGVYLATCVSGKGLRAYPGLAMVLYSHEVAPAPEDLPRYLDLGFCASCDGIPFTHSSNLVHALLEALENLRPTDRFEETSALSAWLRSRLRSLGYDLVAPEAHAAPGVITIALPTGLKSDHVGREVEGAGYLIGYRSHYLVQRNWVQVGLMVECAQKTLTPLLAKLRELSSLGVEGNRASWSRL